MRGAISFFETLARDVNFALRTLRRAPLVVLTIVSTIALGLGVVTVAFTGVPCVARAAGGQCPHGDEHSAAGVHRTDRLRRTDGSPGDWRVWAFLIGCAFVSTVMFGLVPALHSTRLELVRAMRGEVTRDARPSRVRQVLIGRQVTA